MALIDGTPTGPWTPADEAMCAAIAQNPSNVQFADGEVPASTGDPRVFTLVNAPYPASSLKLYLGGLRQSSPGDFTLSGSTITYSQAPQAGLPQVADYRY